MIKEDVVIRATGVGKKFSIGHRSQRGSYVALRDVVGQKIKALLRTTGNLLAGQPIVEGDEVEEFWALNDLSFEIRRGEVVGIIGRNGAGKSTLLKVLSRITELSEGRIEIQGRVASLLEVGSGFHPELTGRENIFLNGALLGMTRSEIKQRFSDIVEFAGTENFLDTPVKRYSSGMYTRLAFAVAAHLESEILIIDEVLAVGDAEFQRKCLSKMSDVTASGRTILFVSHNEGALRTLCTRGLVIDAGRLVFDSPIEQALSKYASLQKTSRGLAGTATPLASQLFCTQLACEPVAAVSGESLTVHLTLHAESTTTIRAAALLLYSSNGQRVAILDLRFVGLSNLSLNGSLTIRLLVEALPLVEGLYSWGIWIQTADHDRDVYDIAELSVLPQIASIGIAPINAHHRGFVELDWRRL